MMDEFSPARREHHAKRITRTIERHFAHWEALPDFDREAAFASYLTEVRRTEDRRSFVMASMRFVASLGNGHTAFDDAWLWREHGAPLDFDAFRLGRNWFITASRIPDLTAGQKVIAIDGMPMERFAADRAAFIAGSNEQARMRRLFSRAFLFPDVFDLGLEDGAIQRIERGRAPRATPPMAPSGRWIDQGRALLLSLPSFGTPRFEEAALSLVRTLPADVHLIVDVRGNAGGDTPQALVSALMPVPYRFWKVLAWSEQAGRRSLTTVEAEWREPSPNAFRGPLTILIDGGTFSAAEDFVLPFKDNGRALIVGSITGGSSGQPIVTDLGDGMRLWVGAKRQYMPDGAPFEGHGIAPHFPVDIGAADISGGGDAALAAAIARRGSL